MDKVLSTIGAWPPVSGQSECDGRITIVRMVSECLEDAMDEHYQALEIHDVEDIKTMMKDYMNVRLDEFRASLLSPGSTQQPLVENDNEIMSDMKATLPDG